MNMLCSHQAMRASGPVLCDPALHGFLHEIPFHVPCKHHPWHLQSNSCSAIYTIRIRPIPKPLCLIGERCSLHLIFRSWTSLITHIFTSLPLLLTATSHNLSLPNVVTWRRQRHPTPVLLPENPMDGGAWWAVVHGVAKSPTRLSDFTFPFHFHALEKEMATHSSVLAWRIPGTGEPGGLPSMGSHRAGHDWHDLAAAAMQLLPLVMSTYENINCLRAICNSSQPSRKAITALWV